MIHHLFALPRDRSTRAASYGYSTRVGFTFDLQSALLFGHDAVQSAGPDFFALGQPFEVPGAGRCEPCLAKSVEHHLNGNGHGEIDTIVERLFYRQGDQLRPYRIRVRFPRGIATVVPTRQLAAIHQEVTHTKLDWADPRHLYVSALSEQPESYRNEALWTLNAMIDSPWPIDRFARHTLTAGAVAEDLAGIGQALWSIETTRLSPRPGTQRFAPGLNGYSHRAMQLLRDRALTHLPVSDGLTGRTLSEPVALESLLARLKPSTLDGRISPALVPEFPAVTQQADEFHAPIADMLDRVAASDVDLTYILLNGNITDTRISCYYDRYAAYAVMAHHDEELLKEIARQLSLHYVPAQPGGNFMVKSRVRIRRTYSEEALVEVFAGNNPTPVIALYFDLAALSLAGVGLSPIYSPSLAG